MSFQWPLVLIALLVVPAVLVGYLVLQRRRALYAVRFTNLEVLAAVVPTARPWRRYLPVALFLPPLATAVSAPPPPQGAGSEPVENASVVLTIDTSGSMYAADVPPTRLAAATEAVRRFLKKLPAKYRVGIVSFSTEPQVVAPLTSDRAAVEQALTYLFPGAGTAIGDGIARSVSLARSDEAAAAADDGSGSGSGSSAPSPRAIVLLSDGSQTRGFLTPLEGAARAKAAHIPIYTVALGTPNGVVRFQQGGYERVFPVPPDPGTLRQIATATGGRFYAAQTASGLNAVYEHLGSSIGRVPQKREATYAALAIAALLLVAAWALSAQWAQRLP